MKPTAWTDLPRNLCRCNENIGPDDIVRDEAACPKDHAVDDVRDDRYTFWETAKGGDYTAKKPYGFSDFDTLLFEVRGMNTDKPFAPGEAVVKDLATEDQLDAVAFLKVMADRPNPTW
jgi:hypothetical protein